MIIILSNIYVILSHVFLSLLISLIFSHPFSFLLFPSFFFYFIALSYHNGDNCIFLLFFVISRFSIYPNPSFYLSLYSHQSCYLSLYFITLGTTIGIVVGIVIFILLVALVIGCLVHRHIQKR